MSNWPAATASRVLGALLEIGWRIKTTIRLTSNTGARLMAGFRFAFHDSEEIGPRMLARVAKRTGLTANDL